ncbi:hypothetical protein [Methanolapillus millepedarum]|uniref:Transglutaminase-like domain-containing protein n=1 Tax=Methanolapillus millepedarum TaxID=3028296 RepID=A0AA96V3R7_9EURY|nr:hypothetical protein MsAc7_04590 [Methanosarcinaceae archaeon Ac7]
MSEITKKTKPITFQVMGILFLMAAVLITGSVILSFLFSHANGFGFYGVLHDHEPPSEGNDISGYIQMSTHDGQVLSSVEGPIPVADVTPGSDSSNEKLEFKDSDDSVYYSQTFHWEFEGDQWSYTVYIPEDSYTYFKSKSHTRNDYEQYALSDYDRACIRQIADTLTVQGQENNYTQKEIALNAIAFVQSIPYASDLSTTGYDEYPRYPVETLVDGYGDCEDSAILGAAILNEMGFEVALLEFPHHMALGLKSDGTKTKTISDGTHHYEYVETTTTDFEVGEIPSNVDIDQVTIHPMVQVPKMSATLTYKPVAFDLEFVYYKVEADLKNKGPGLAENVCAHFFVEVNPDSGEIYPPDFDIAIGNLSEDGTGYASTTLRVPRGEEAKIALTVHGDTFDPVTLKTEILHDD